VHLPISNNCCNYGFLSYHKKRIFHFTYSWKGPNGWFVVRWLLQLPHIGVIEGRPNPRLHVLSRCVGIHRFISKTWPLKYKLQKEVQKLHLIFLSKIRRGVLDVWNTKTYLKLGLPIDPAHTAGAAILIFWTNNYNMCHKTIRNKL
jgi:hypothetical protein